MAAFGLTYYVVCLKAINGCSLVCFKVLNFNVSLLSFCLTEMTRWQLWLSCLLALISLSAVSTQTLVNRQSKSYHKFHHNNVVVAIGER